jgi:DnaJ-class molecular chaperone
MPDPAKIIAEVDETTGLTAVIVLEETCGMCGGNGAVPRGPASPATFEDCPRCDASGLALTPNGQALLAFLARHGL